MLVLFLPQYSDVQEISQENNRSAASSRGGKFFTSQQALKPTKRRASLRSQNVKDEILSQCPLFSSIASLT